VYISSVTFLNTLTFGFLGHTTKQQHFQKGCGTAASTAQHVPAVPGIKQQQALTERTVPSIPYKIRHKCDYRVLGLLDKNTTSCM
jgi:hypothetical protein